MIMNNNNNNNNYNNNYNNNNVPDANKAWLVIRPTINI